MATISDESNSANSVPVSAELSKGEIWKVIGASSAGTVIEWYDFYIFGSLATIIAPLFYPPGNDTFALIMYLVTFAVGFIVRPFGALFFGRIGDLVGRKYAFLVTLLIMGGATAAVGFLPTFSQIGWAAPVALILIRILARSRARRRIRRCDRLCRRACAGRKTRILYEFYTDHGFARFAYFARRHSRIAKFDEQSSI